MATQAKSFFSTRVPKFETAINSIKSWSNFQPSLPELSITNLDLLIQLILATKKEEDKQLLACDTALTERQILFVKGDGGVDTLGLAIHKEITSQSRKNSPSLKTATALLKNMRAIELVKMPDDPSHWDAQETVSLSQQSYQAKTHLFEKLVKALLDIEGYKPGSLATSKSTLEQKLKQLKEANYKIANVIQLLIMARYNKDHAYAEMFERITKLKSETERIYGEKSPEYHSLQSLNF